MGTDGAFDTVQIKELKLNWTRITRIDADCADEKNDNEVLQHRLYDLITD